jgi:hypothetical protein
MDKTVPAGAAEKALFVAGCIAASGSTDIRMSEGVYRSIESGASNPPATSINASAVNVVQADNLVSSGITATYP